MSRVFGKIEQLGYIVENVDEAVRHWVEVLGVGPFFVTDMSFNEYVYRGEGSDPKLRVAFSYSGDMQIELIEPVNQARSFYRDWLEEHGPGLQHVCMFLENYDADVARFEALGHSVIHYGTTDGGIRFKYYDTAFHPGTIVEVADLPKAGQGGIEFMKQAAAAWDGTDPMRVLG